MEICIDRNAEESLYLQLAQQLRGMIENGIYQVGEKLPAEAVLAAESKLAVGTVKSAYRSLREQGYITSVRGGGSYVIYQQNSTELTPAELVGGMYRRLKKDTAIYQIYQKAQKELMRIYNGERQVQAAYVGSCDEITYCIRLALEKVKNLQLSTYRLDELLSGAKRINSRCDLVLASQKLFGRFVSYADVHQLHLEPLSLRSSRETLARIMLLPENSSVFVIYRNKAFFQEIEEMLQELNRKLHILAVNEDALGDEIEEGAKMGVPFIIPADYLEHSNAGALQLISRARKYGCEVIPCVYEVDGGSYVTLEETIQSLCLTEGGAVL